MKINILTIFPNLIESFLDNGIIRRAVKNKVIEVNVINLRDYEKQVDDYSFGGKDGIVLKLASFEKYFNKNAKTNSNIVIYSSPQGVKLNNKLSKELSKNKEITLICGHYEGVDERVIERYVDLEVSIGDYVLSGGELPTLVILDSILRFIPNFIKENSVKNDSFENNRLDNSVYTRPSDGVPKVLLSGNHSLVDEYRDKDSLYRTLLKRPDILSNKDIQKLKNIISSLEKNI